MQPDFVFTSESVTEGHPDKLCDQISDAIVGHYLRQDPVARVTAECAVSTGLVFLSVKVRSVATINAADAAREVIRKTGYVDPGFNPKNCTVMTSLHEYSDGELGHGNGRSAPGLDSIVAQDQATLFGFACTHTPVLMPLPIHLAHLLAARLAQVRKSGALDYLAPDGKTQVAIEFRNRKPARIHSLTLLVSQLRSHTPSASRLKSDIMDDVIRPVFVEQPLSPDATTRIAINPEGPFVKGGPEYHAGLTGRKTAVDTYGEFARHSGAALSGKDPTRIDRVGAYAARYAAKNVVAAGLAELCEVQLSYSIGLASPVSVQVETYGTSSVSEDEIASRIRRTFDFRVGAIIRQFELQQRAAKDVDFYRKLACYGQVGRLDLDLPWEKLDRVDVLR